MDDNNENKKEELDMGIAVPIEKPEENSTPAESLKKAFDELKEIKEGKKKTRSWWDFLKSMDTEDK